MMVRSAHVVKLAPVPDISANSRVLSNVPVIWRSFLTAASLGTIPLDSHNFTLPLGFSIERVSNPLLVERPIAIDFDERGRLYLLDRKHDMIISGGANVYPREVEEALVRHGAVAEAAVFGIPDREWGEIVVAAVVAAEGTTLDELRQNDGTLGYSANLRHGVTGRGLNDYDAIFSILAGAGYSGWVSIEDGMNGMGEVAESLEFLRGKIARYFPS